MFSMYKHMENLASAHQVESLDHFADSFMQDKVHHAPFFHMFKSYWEHIDQPNFHYVSYERLHEVYVYGETIVLWCFYETVH